MLSFTQTCTVSAKLNQSRILLPYFLLIVVLVLWPNRSSGLHSPRRPPLSQAVDGPPNQSNPLFSLVSNYSSFPIIHWFHRAKKEGTIQYMHRKCGTIVHVCFPKHSRMGTVSKVSLEKYRFNSASVFLLFRR